MAVGHRLRDATIERAPAPARRVEVAVVGAGVSGLTAAWRLARLGERDYVLLDVEQTVGGSSAYGTDGVVPYPWGAHYLPLPRKDNPALLHLLSEMAVVEPTADGSYRVGDRQLVRQPAERVFYAGRWYEGLLPWAAASAADREQFDRFQREVNRWVRWRDGRGRRAFTLPLRRCSDDAEVTGLDRISAARWLDERGLNSALLRWYVEYGCRDDYGLGLESTSAWAMLFYFAARVPTVGAESAPFLTWPEGNGRLVQHLAQASASRAHTGQLVTDLVPAEQHVELCALDVATQTLHRYLARQVIVAVPRFVAARILRPWRDSPPAHVAHFSYGPWLVANLHLKRRPRSRGFGPAWDNVLMDSPALGYVVATHQQLSDYGPTVWTYYHALTDADARQARRKLASLDHAHITDAILSDLGRAHEDLEAAVERIDVWRWGHAMIRPTPGFIWGSARRQAAQTLGRIHFAHSDLSGLALFEEAFDRGVSAAEAVARALGRKVHALGGE
jgi:protoporphyrinogen oxidase